MEFGWNEDQTRYRERLRSIIDEELPEDWWSEYAYDGPSNPKVMNYARTFARRLAREGLVTPHWPKAYGGSDFDAWAQIIINEEMWAAGEPRSSLYMGANWAGPVIMEYGTEAQKQKHLRPIAAGEVMWCQGFSEPSAGSDLASLRTRAEKVDGGYIINGSKIWTSYAHSADWCFLLARTYGTGREGICCFLLATDTPGVVRRPIPGISATHDMHETFLTDVFVADEYLLGEEGKGWEIVGTLLSYERVGVARYEFASRAIDRAVELLAERGEFDNAEVQTAAAVARARCEAARMLTYQVINERAKGIAASGTTNLARMAMIEADHAAINFISGHLPDVLVEGGDGLCMAEYKIATISGIASGALEIQRNMAAYRVLGLSSRG